MRPHLSFVSLKRRTLLLLLALLSWSAAFTAQALSLPKSEPVEGFGVVNAFPGLRFDQPVGIVSIPGDTQRLFVVERPGRILVITNLATPTKTVFLDLRANIQVGSIESGLLGLAFHPGYLTNRQFFVFRTKSLTSPGSPSRGLLVLSRFLASPGPEWRALPESETVLFAQEDDIETHNGGDLQFGPDGYLYITTGEHPPGLPPSRNLSRIDAGLFGVLRIDVDQRPGNLPPNPHAASPAHYFIPATNPFVGATHYLGEPVNPSEVRTELFALGFRNPWRLHVDAVSGLIYAGDVGSNLYEEIDLIRPGAQYGWPYREGDLSYALPEPEGFAPEPPLWSGSRGWEVDQGECVVGGLVYHGSTLPGLNGAYLFGDYLTGHIRALRHDAQGRLTEIRRLTGVRTGVSSFGYDPRDGEVLLAQVMEGIILKLIYQEPTAPELPRSLSQVGAFQDLLHLLPAPELQPYEINVPFWSDNAIKHRWFSSAAAAGPIQVGTDGSWGFPAGMVWVKHFEMEMIRGVTASSKRLETRFLVKTDAGIYGVTYRWNKEGTDAQLVGPDGERETLFIQENGTIRQQEWRYPSRQDCLHCHSAWGGYALGFNASQLNRDFTPGNDASHQLSEMNRAGYFQPALANPKVQPRLARLDDSEFPLEFRVRSYLQANCIPCHNPGQPSLVAWNAQMRTSLAESGLLDGRVVIPGHPEQSWLVSRISSPRTSTSTRMPPLLSTVLDTHAVEHIMDWIAFMPQAPWVYGDLGTPLLPGASSISNEVYRVAGSFAEEAGPDSAQFLSRPITHDSLQLMARVVDCSNFKTGAVAGLSVREERALGAPFVSALLGAGCQGIFQYRTLPNGPVQTQSTALEPGTEWLRLQKEGEVFRAYASADGSHWTPLGSASVPMSGARHAGLITSSHDSQSMAQATFLNVSLIGVSLATPASGLQLGELQPLDVQPDIVWVGKGLRGAEFWANGRRLGSVSTPPYSFTWQQPDPGHQTLEVVLLDDSGGRLHSRPVEIDVAPTRARAATTQAPSIVAGQWIGNLGTQGHWLAGEAKQDGEKIHLNWSLKDPTWLNHGDLDPRALTRSSGVGRIAASWSEGNELLLDISTTASALYRVSLYAADWNIGSLQRVEWLDPVTGSVLKAEEWRDFTQGRWGSWTLRGSVRLRIVGLAGSSPQLGAIFVDPGENLPPSVAFTVSNRDGVHRLPAPLELSAAPLDPDGIIDRIEFHAGERVMGSLTAPPWLIQITNLLAGTYAISCRVWDRLGDGSQSPTQTVTITLPPSSAVFAGEDLTTRGDWPGRYGRLGWMLPLESQWPFDVDQQFTAAVSQTDLGGNDNSDFPLNVESDGRSKTVFLPGIDTTTGSNTLSFTFKVLDGQTRRLSAYVYRPGSSACLELRLTDVETGRLLDWRPVSPSDQGVYLSWEIRGAVRMEVSARCGSAFLSALFLDADSPEAAPAVTLTRPLSGYQNTAPTLIRLEASAHSANGPVTRVEFFAKDQLLGECASPPFALDWAATTSGTSEVWARAFDSRGRSADSERVTLSVRLESPTRAQYVGMDHETGGHWMGHYGTTGWDIADIGSHWPANVEKIQSPQELFVWNPVSFDENALMRPETYLREEAVWFSRELPLRVQLRFKDAASHRVSFYFTSFYEDHHLHVDVFDSHTRERLDSRDFLHLLNAGYATWEIQGDVDFELRPTQTFPAQDMVWYAGVFVDPGPGPLSDWKRTYFNTSELADPSFSGDEADPDGDGLSNLAEYGLGRDPRVRDVSASVHARVENGQLRHTFRHARNAFDAVWQLHISEDLIHWTPAPTSSVDVDPDDQFETVTTVIPLSESKTGRHFIRLRWVRISQPQSP